MMNNFERHRFLLISIALGLAIAGLSGWLLVAGSAVMASAQEIQEEVAILNGGCAATYDDGTTVYSDLQQAADECNS